MTAGGSRLPGGEFRAMWTAEGLSTLGDQLAKVSLAVIVYERTGSAAATSLVFALTLLPPIVAAPLLGSLADRLPRRELMVACCLVQAIFVALMALPGAPFWLLAASVVAVAGISSPFRAAQKALALDVLGTELNKAGSARLSMIREIGQLAGLAGAAGAVAVVGTTWALLLDVLSFVGAGALLGFGLRFRPSAREIYRAEVGAAGSPWTTLRADPHTRTLVGLIMVIGVTMMPDAVVVPLVEQAGAPAWTVGLMLAADCLGMAACLRWAERLSAARQRALIAPLVLLNIAPLVLFAIHPGPVLIAVLLVFSGVGAGYLPLAIGELQERLPRANLGATTALAGAGLRLSQGVVAVLGGLLAELLGSAAAATAWFGGLGLLIAGFYAAQWRRLPVEQVSC